MSQIEDAYKQLDLLRKSASVAKIGGFRPPENLITSWFGGRGVGRRGEVLPTYQGKDMFPLLQVNIEELPVVPSQVNHLAFLVVFINRDELPFNKVHGDGWEIREYTAIDDLVLLPESSELPIAHSFPIRWIAVDDDAPNWENAWELMDLSPINDAPGAEDKFFSDYNRYPSTKFGGYPYCIQSEANLDGFVFQISSEEKPRWMWADNGVAYFNRDDAGEWTFDCQFY